ncbi:bacillithiol biosynthesis cysteine-adding enzyme BshC [Gelidibacter maritimus]|uniref:Putative cysteine ligase BshC n=1 Tax=Gelidibacter maritimus TaxID=2761487 RepID=A0A7W2R3K1_9FLAO|nr:bacillithiol biosynthesis cysteine-adding enzyme BshC [Gelidibacter maritimus]MBA6152937.1 bacillithiol biosynthesis cysteine-adding enzyme BshC [Gelidibacter maritimus]
MPTRYIPFRDTNYFSNLISDYLDEKESLKAFYNRFPKLENFEEQIEEKQINYNKNKRADLVKALMLQYEGLSISSMTLTNIDLLKHGTTFTVTTGHQLNLFTGPLYFFYKIVSTINLCKELKAAYPNFNFVPIFWMATEDHDFEEINFFNFKGKKVKWDRKASGAVGELDLDGLDHVYEVFAAQLDKSQNAKSLKRLFQQAYLEHETLTEATRFLVNKLFSVYGLVILDGSDPILKKMYEPYITEELIQQTAYEKVTKTNEEINKLPSNYKIQVNPREINLFYLNKDIRERILETDGVFGVLDTDIRWTKDELLAEVNAHPERFSPNVILRPMYQEIILPNLCYIGGGGELAYWLQLKSNFEAQDVTFPILLLRNSVLLITEKQTDKLNKLNIPVTDLFLNQNDLMTKVTKSISDINIDFTPQKEQLQKQFEYLYQLAGQTDKSFIGAVAAQEVKQIKGLENLEQRLLKAQKRKMEDVLERVKIIQDELFPRQSLQERYLNISEFYLEYGEDVIQNLIENLEPLKAEFLILDISNQ